MVEVTMKMLNRVPNPPTYISRHNDIVDAKTNLVVQASLNSIKSEVTARYQCFQNELVHRNLHGISKDDLMLENKDDLLSCYKNKTKKTLAIFDEIKSSQNDGSLSKCPYCGITRAGTYDHYLPEANYPEFSVHAINLIPCCAECNSTKGNRLVSGGVRQFLHFYSDPIPNQQFLHVEITTRPNSLAYGVRFFLQKPQGYSNTDWQLIENHFKRLKLLNRYKEESNDEVITCFSASKSFIKNGGVDVAGFIGDICDDEELKLGGSHWRVVLKRQLALMPDFVAHVISEANRH